MGGTYQPKLQPTTTVSLADYRHASAIFRANAYGNSPKFKWLFHVFFDINRAYVSADQSIFSSPEIPGLLVKNISLPKYSVQLAEMNQYNRKRYVQTKLTYDPIQVVFHDDNLGQIRNLWYQYFSYYYYDPNNPQGQQDEQNAVSQINIRNTYANDISKISQWGYTAETPNSASAAATGVTKAPFFRSIKIYGFDQHSFAYYELVNPIIERFEHDTYDYYQTTGTMENRMTIRYETVKYQQGALNGNDPSAIVDGFALTGEYDKILSPIAAPGSNSQVLGQGSLVDPGPGYKINLKNPFTQPSPTATSSTQYTNSPFITPNQQLMTGVINAASNPYASRGSYNLPSLGSGSSGPTAQITQPSSIMQTGTPTPLNNPIPNLNTGGKTLDNPTN